MNTKKPTAKVEKPCRNFMKHECGDELGRDHCFNCARHLDPKTMECPKGCGKSTEQDDKVTDSDQDEE